MPFDSYALKLLTKISHLYECQEVAKPKFYLLQYGFRSCLFLIIRHKMIQDNKNNVLVFIKIKQNMKND